MVVVSAFSVNVTCFEIATGYALAMTNAML